MTREDDAESAFAERWFADWGTVTHRAVAEHAGDGVPEASLVGLLEVNPDLLNDFTSQLLELPPKGEIGSTIHEIRHGVHAYLQFQDLLEVLVDGESPLEGRHYPYYESVVFLREGVSSLILGRHLAALALARPFLELAITHVYWKTRGDDGGYGDYYKWLSGGHSKPPFRNMLDWTVANLPVHAEVKGKRLEQLVEALRHIYRRVCAYHHTPEPKESVVTLGGGLSDGTVYPFMLAMTLWSILIREVVHLFVLVYPMSLFPRPFHERFGFSAPVGVFSDITSSRIITRFLSPSAVHELTQRLEKSELVRDRLGYFEQMPQLSQAELDTAWQEFRARSRMPDDTSDLAERLMRAKSLSRAMGWTVNYLQGPKFEDVPDEVVDKALDRLRDWRTS